VRNGAVPESPVPTGLAYFQPFVTASQDISDFALLSKDGMDERNIISPLPDRLQPSENDGAGLFG
jgi:hypothetical protein